jgi:hypothetical protein
MLADGADVNAPNDTGQTPIILAIVTGQYQLVALLIRARANPFLRDNTRLNAIDWAERKGRPDLGHFMLKQSRSDLPHYNTEPPEPKPLNVEPDPPSPRLSADEKARRFVAGLKQRIEEQARREPVQAVSAPVIEPKPPSMTLPIPDIGSHHETQPEPAPTTTPIESLQTSSHKKRCPECGAIYDSELLGYCAYHVVPLVPISDLDVAVPLPSAARARAVTVLWILGGIALAAGAVAGGLIMKQLFTSPAAEPVAVTVAQPAPPKPQRGTPSLSSRLEGKALSLPEPEVPANTVKEPTQIFVKVKLNSEGQVFAATSEDGEQVLRDAAIEAAKKSTFSIEKFRRRWGVWGTITYTFQ